MSRSPDVVIIGGGIVGLCTAVAAAERGMWITVIDDRQPGAASRASAGMLAPSLPGLPESVRGLACTARDMYVDAVARISAQSGVSIHLDRSGILEIAATGPELDLLPSRACGAVHLSQRELAVIEPALKDHAGAIFHPDDGWVDNQAMMDALSTVLQRHARVDVITDRVARVDVSRDGTVAVLTNGDRIGSSRMVNATGAWAAHLTGLPRQLPVRPVKGELLTLDICPVHHVVYGAAGYLVPRANAVLVGATNDEGSFDATPSIDGREFLTSAAAALAPELSRARVVHHWAALRPCSPDGLPILGEDVNNPLLLHACGFSRNGVLLAPWAGESLAALLAGDVHAAVPPEFSPSRFAENW